MLDEDGDYVIAPLTPERVSIGDTAVPVVAFYCPDTGLTPCDRRSGGAPFANFWPLPAPISIEHGGASGTFTNSEAAYQASHKIKNSP